MPQNFYTLLTQTGASDFVTAQAYGLSVPLTHLAVGDGGGEPVFPVEPTVALVGEVFRIPVTSISIDPDNPNWLIVETVIPANVGGWTIREIGLIGGLNPDNLAETPTNPGQKLLAHGNFPATYKPLLSEGAGKDMVIRMIVEVGNASLVQLTIDPSVVVATQRHVAQAIAAHEAEADPHSRYLTDAEGDAKVNAHTLDPDPHPQYFNESRLETRLESLINGTLHYVGQVWQIVPDAPSLSDPVISGPPAGRPNGRRVIVTGYPASATGHAMAVWNAEGSVWVLADLALSVFDLYGCDIDDHGYYWFGEGWNLLDLDNIGNATESDAGVVRLATSTETLAGTNAVTAVTPAGLAPLLRGRQPLDATLTALAGLPVTVADRMMYATGADAFALTPLTAFARTLLDDANAATALTTLGAAPLDSPALTGTPTAPTQAAGNKSNRIATTAFVQTAAATAPGNHNAFVAVAKYGESTVVLRLTRASGDYVDVILLEADNSAN